MFCATLKVEVTEVTAARVNRRILAPNARRIFVGVYMEKTPHRLSAWPAPQGWPFYWPHAAARGSMSTRKAKNLRLECR